MKKVKYTLFTLFAMGIFCLTYSQEEVQDPNLIFKTLTKKFEKSEQDIQNPKKNTSSSTWIKRGDILIDIFNNDQKYLGIGMSKDQAILFYKNPKEETTEERNGETLNVLVYERLKIYLKQDKIEDWIVTQMVTEEPLIKAFEAYKKGIELDESGKIVLKLSDQVDELKLAFEKEASMSFRRGEYEKSMKCFSYAFNTSELKAEEERVVDTANIYNAGLAASNAKLYEEAIKYFNIAKKYNYGGTNLYILLKDAYVNLNDSAKILPLLQDGFKNFPESKDIIVELINYYLTSDQEKEALEYLKIAKEKDPANATYYFAEGTLHDKLGEMDKTVASYEKAIELNPEWFDPYYNMGVIYYNSAVEIFEEASKIPPRETKKYDAEMMRGNDELEKALPYMEKALEIAESDFIENPEADDVIKTYKGTLETLKTIYFRLRNRSEEYQKKLEDTEAKLAKFN